MEMEGDSTAMRSSRSGSHAEAVRRTIRHMRVRLDHKVDLDELAAVACMSPCHYLRVFRRLTGIPPARFLGILRLELAKDLLIRTDLAVFDIALDVGYTSLGTFTSRFAQLVGMSPARFRETYISMMSGAAMPAQVPPAPVARDSGATYVGQIDHDEGDINLFAGVFGSPIPQEAPLACAILAGGRHFSLPVPEGIGPFYILAVALKHVQPGEAFDNRALIAGVAACGPLRPTDTSIPLQLHLRPVDLLDPPILVAFPLLMNLHMAALPATAMEAAAPRHPAPLSSPESVRS